jgi:hypothetical protein
MTPHPAAAPTGRREARLHYIGKLGIACGSP